MAVDWLTFDSLSSKASSGKLILMIILIHCNKKATFSGLNVTQDRCIYPATAEAGSIQTDFGIWPSSCYHYFSLLRTESDCVGAWLSFPFICNIANILPFHRQRKQIWKHSLCLSKNPFTVSRGVDKIFWSSKNMYEGKNFIWSATWKNQNQELFICKEGS